MRILIAGNDPNEIGGVANYTRPLAQKFSALGHEVYYLFSGAYHSRYDFSLKPRLRVSAGPFPFECAEIVNSTCLTFNFGHPELDMQAPEMEALIAGYLDRVRPDVMHVHSRFGLPASINKLASDRGILVLNTIHVYGYICQKRVMIDREGAPCPGPADLEKCALCTGTLDYRKERFRAVLRNYNKSLKVKAPAVFSLLQSAKGTLKPARPCGAAGAGKAPTCAAPAPLLARALGERLSFCTDMLNSCCDMTICVSTDVKNTLMRYGVAERGLLVQHIGSVIAEKQVTNRMPPRRPLVVGNIGGVNYYKGTHVLVEAVSKLRRSDYTVRIFGKYSGEYVSALMARFPGLPIEFTGRYLPQDLPGLLKQVDVMVLPSICNDTAPQTIFESFSGGVPIIAPRIGGFPDFVQHDQNGLLFDAGDSDDLADKIGFILDHPERLPLYKQRLPRLKTISENADELISLYGALLHHPRAAHAR